MKRVLGSRFVLLATLTLLACQTADDRSAASRAVEGVDSSPTEADLEQSIHRLKDLQSSFQVLQNGFLTLDIPGDLVEALASQGEESIRALVDCIDDLSPSRVTLDGRPVFVGVVCGMGLHRIAYPILHEDSDELWAGTVAPDATADDLRRAKTAWLEVIEAGTYRIG